MSRRGNNVFRGTVQAGNLDLTVCTYAGQGSAAVIFSLPFDVDPFTLHEFCGASGTNYGMPECSAYAYTAAQAVEDSLTKDMRVRAQLAVNSVKHGYDGKMFNIAVTLASKKKSQIKGVLKKGIRAMKFPLGNATANMKKL